MSADDPNIVINGVNINYQYSKTSQFEKDLNMLLRQKIFR